MWIAGIVTAIIAAILAGATTYLLARHYGNAKNTDLQDQINALRAQVSAAPTATPVATATPTATPTATADPTAGWSTVTNKSLGFSLKYPTDWSVVSRDETATQLSSKAWIAQTNTTGQAEISVTYYAKVSDFDSMKPATLPALIAEQSSDSLLSNAKPVTFAGESAYTATQGGNKAQYVVLVPHGGHLYMIAFSRRESASELTATETAILNSFSFTK